MPAAADRPLTAAAPARLTAKRLTDAQVRAINQPGKRFDPLTTGLFLLVRDSARGVVKHWRYRYWWTDSAGKRSERLLALGPYPAVGLAEARALAAEAAAQVARGIDPVRSRQTSQREAKREAETTFEAIARLFADAQRQDGEWTEAHHRDCVQRLEKWAFARIGSLPIGSIAREDIASVLAAVRAAGRQHMAGRIKTLIDQTFRWAIAHGFARDNPAVLVREIRRKAAAVRHMPAITDGIEIAAVVDANGHATAEAQDTAIAATVAAQVEAVRSLLAAVESGRAGRLVKLATRLLALTAVRTIELRGARWSEFDLDPADGGIPTWTIPAERMKRRATHVVPLSPAAVAVLRELRPMTDIAGGPGYVFPGSGPKHPIMSEATINAALARAGFKGRATGHGFRSSFSTIANAAGWRPDAIEHALAHVPNNVVRAAYNRGSLLAERAALMRAWAEWLTDGYNVSASNVVPMRARAA
ncbi:MAG: tyrosine-type recombinase/integrase [Burkholderiaceae bacterium]